MILLETSETIFDKIANLPATDIFNKIKVVSSMSINNVQVKHYDIEKNINDRPAMFTVSFNSGGYVIINAFVPPPIQNKGIAMNFLIKINEESLKATGRPAKSQYNISDDGDYQIDISPDGERLWDALVNRGLVIKFSNKNYTFKPKK